MYNIEKTNFTEHYVYTIMKKNLTLLFNSN